MVRAPCCEKMGLKKGPWTAEEDQVLVDYINKHGHGNWRALPKQAGLLRCGKSCRLRWMNYLRPDIKRGNFSQEEEETIITLHEKLGNRWSAIAARLPGRTDNEIKNVWHTNLKKRVNPSTKAQQESKKKAKCDAKPKKTESKPKTLKVDTNMTNATNAKLDDNSRTMSLSPANSCSDFSSSSAVDSCSTSGEISNGGGGGGGGGGAKEESFSSEEFQEIDESFWMEVLSMDNSDTCMDHISSFSSSDRDDLEFWSNMFMESGGLQEDLAQF